MKLRSFFPLNILLQHDDSEHPAASVPLQQPATGGSIYLGAWLCQPLVNFIPMKSPKSFPADSRRRKFIVVLLKQFFFSWNSLSIEQKSPIRKFLPFLEGKKPSKPHLLKERMWLSQLVYLRHSLDVCPTSCLVQVKHWRFSGHGHRIQDVSVRRRLLTKVAISSGSSQTVLC